MYDLTDKVYELYGEDLMLEMANPDTKDPRVRIDLAIRHDVLNVEIYGTVTDKGKTRYYSVEDGNNNGTVFHALEATPITIPSTRIIRVPKIVPKIDNELTRLKAKAMQPQLEEIARSLSYDKYVTANSDKTRDYWQNKVDSIGGKVIYEEVEIPT